jgi:hypothetical protein
MFNVRNCVVILRRFFPQLLRAVPVLESDLNEEVRKLAARHRLFFQRFEDAVSPGIPDAYLGVGNRGARGVWVELKVTGTVRERPVYRPGQLAWAHRADQAGEKCVTLIASMDGGFRVLDTAAVAEAIALGKGFASVPAIAIASSLESVLGAVLGVALTGGRVSA